MSAQPSFLERHRASLVQFVRFGLVGGVGVLVNQGVLVVANLIGRDVFKVRYSEALFSIPGTEYNVRLFNLYSVVSFLLANLANFVLNRYWTFRSGNRAAFWREYFPFLLVGLAALVVGQGIITALVWPASPVALPRSIFDDSSGLRSPLYWANLIMIVLVTPVNFVLNKLWTFRSVRAKHGYEVRAAAEEQAADGGQEG